MIDIEKTCEMLRNRSSMYNRKVVQKNNVPPGLENKSRIVGKGERFGINEEKCMEEKPYLSKLMGKRERFAEKQEEQFDIERDDGDSPKEQMQIKKLLSDYILPKEQFERGGEREECQERRPKQELKPRKWNLNQIEQAVLDKMNIIYHEGNLYWYTGRHYQIIRNGEELFRLIRAKVSKDAFGATSVKWISDLFMFLKTDPNLVPDDYEEKLLQAKTLISFKNGVLDLETMNLYNHSPDYLIFYTINAKWEKNTEAYHFKEFLKSMSGGDKFVAKRVKEALGYLLSVSNDGKYFFVMGTAPNSGKSTLGELLQEIVGREHVAHISTHQIGGRFALGDIHGKTLNLSMDLPKGKLSPVVVSIIKQITGGDVITTDQKYERMKEVHSNMRFVFASNYPVAISKEDDDDAFWNRMVIIPFQYSVKDVDVNHDMLQNLLGEKDAIICMCIKAFHNVLMNNYMFSECEVAEQMKRSWRNEEDEIAFTMKTFVDECVEITGNPQDYIYSQDFYEAYQIYCEQYNLPCMRYNKVIDWCLGHLTGCEKKRIHITGNNPRSGLSGLKFLEGGNV